MNNIQPRIETLATKKLVGYVTKMNLIHNKTGEVWSKMMSNIKAIQNRTSTDKISMQIYDTSYFQKFNPTNEFEKWATVEVDNFENIPAEMQSFELKGGSYAVFDYKGSSADNTIFQYIFGTWLPDSPYQLDHRPHFEVLGDKYKNNDPNSEEEIWIPIIKKT